MAKATTRLTNDAMAFLTERHLAMLTTLRSDDSPHVVAVGFTFDPVTHVARVITTGGSQKAVNADQRGIAVLSHGRQPGTTTRSCGRWLTDMAPSAVTTTMSSMRAPHAPGK